MALVRLPRLSADSSMVPSIYDLSVDRSAGPGVAQYGNAEVTGLGPFVVLPGRFVVGRRRTKLLLDFFQ
jgi:hypothetical protein